MDSIDNDEKRFAAHSVNEEGKEFSLAEECARLLRIGRQEGVKSQGKSKKREDAREIEHREWLVWLKEDRVSELKYRTVGFTKEAKQSGGMANRRYHVYCYNLTRGKSKRGCPRWLFYRMFLHVFFFYQRVKFMVCVHQCRSLV
jgi:hypothetical protein